MNVYILADPDNITLGEKFFDNIKNVNFISSFPTYETRDNISMVLKKRVNSRDVILVIADENFSKSKFLNYELQICKKLADQNKNILLLSLILNNAKIPDILKNDLYIKCASTSKDNLYKVQSTIEKLLNPSNAHIKKENSNKLSLIAWSILFLESSIILTLLAYIFQDFLYNFAQVYDIFSTLFITVIAGVFAYIVTSTIQKNNYNEKESQVEYSKKLQKALTPGESDKNNSTQTEEVDALGRMLINLEDIKEFYTWSQRQSKAAFLLAVGMCISGCLLMLIAIFLIAFKSNIQLSIIPAIGSIITELIAGTALVVYRHSLSQLNHYHQALHEDERFLSSVSLISKFSTKEEQDKMLQEIIQSEIQMNLYSLKEKSSDFPRTSSKKDTSI